MTHDERWMAKYNEVMDFMEKNRRNPSHHFYEERNMHSWVHHSRKLMNKGLLKPERVEAFKKLLEMAEENRHINQYK